MTVPKIKHKKLVITLAVILIFILSVLLSYFIILKIGESKLRKNLSNFGEDDSSAYAIEADAYYKGKEYFYNDNLINILCIGVDKDNSKDKTDHQADVILLVSADIETEKANIIAISRNTLTDIEIYDMNGEFLDTEYKQICLSYVYGSDDKQSSLLTQKAVSRLLLDIPINGYYTIFMDSVKDIVDSVGGVNVTVPEDMTVLNPSWKKGANVTIKGKDALSYVQYREDISDVRLDRQKQFVSSFVDSAKKAVAKNLSLPLNMYNKLAKNTVTDVDGTSAVYLASEIIKADFNTLKIPGKVGFDGTYETFEVDETLLYEMVLDVFYKTK